VSDGEIVIPASHGIAGGTLQLTGKAARALELVQEGYDPDSRRSPKAARYHRARLSEDTRRKYLYWIKRYLYFCAVHGRRELPANASTLEHFMIWLAELDPTRGRNRHRSGVGMAPATMRQALAGVRAFHAAAGATFPNNELALGIIDGHEAERARPGTGLHDGEGARPAKLPTLLELIRACPTEGLHRNAGIRDRAILSMGFVIMARRSELCVLDHEHITEESGDLKIWVPKTKTSRKGRVSYLAPWEDHPDCCPVRCVRAWRKLSAELGITSGPFFRGVDNWDNVAGVPGSPFAGVAGDGRLSGDRIEYLIGRAAVRALQYGAELGGMTPDELKPHGVFRSGGASAAYGAKADILAIRRQGGWADTSPVVFRYIREIDLRLNNPMRLVGNQKARSGDA
jgi:hypothetical protein